MGAREKDLNPDTFIGLKLPIGYSETGYFKQTKTTLQQAKYNIINLLKTIPGERLGQPAFGSDLHTMLFEPMNDLTVVRIKSVVETALTAFEPRANVLNVSVEAQEDKNRYKVSVLFDLGTELEAQLLETLLERV